MNKLLVDKIDSELGQILLVSNGSALCALDFIGNESRMATLLKKRFGSFHLVEHPNPQDFSDCVRSYLAGNLTSLQDLPVNLGGSSFQQQVWSTLRTIPIGTVITYAELAQRIGKPTACRAVGMANGQNPIAIVFPCHRVIGANAKLTGYSGGLDRKRWLLKHEGVALKSEPLR